MKFYLVIFLDFDELGAFVMEPQHRFDNVDLEYDVVSYCSAIIVFTDEDIELLTSLIGRINSEYTAALVDSKEGDDYIILSFDLSAHGAYDYLILISMSMGDTDIKVLT